MKVKTSITLSPEALAVVDKHVGESGSRSMFIEKAIRDYAVRSLRRERDRRDLDILNSVTERLNREAVDVLGYQVEV
jgi:metal-responsive CopG/Arc/MetJ family transcriptional regulator